MNENQSGSMESEYQDRFSKHEYSGERRGRDGLGSRRVVMWSGLHGRWRRKT